MKDLTSLAHHLVLVKQIEHGVGKRQFVKVRGSSIYLFLYFEILQHIFFPSAKDCGHLETPMNGSLSGNKTFYPNTVKFSCDEGFDLLGSQVRSCLSSGLWSGNQTSCKGIMCSSRNLKCFLTEVNWVSMLFL